MKLYVWYNLSFLRDYGDGVAYSMAETKEQAIENLLDNDFYDKPSQIKELYESECEELEGKYACGYLNGSS